MNLFHKGFILNEKFLQNHELPPTQNLAKISRTPLDLFACASSLLWVELNIIWWIFKAVNSFSIYCIRMIDCRSLKKRRRSWLIRNLISTRFDLLRFQIRLQTTTDQFFPIMFGQTYKTIRWITIIDQNKKKTSKSESSPTVVEKKICLFLFANNTNHINSLFVFVTPKNRTVVNCQFKTLVWQKRLTDF